MKRVHNCSPSLSTGTKAQRRSKKRKNDCSEPGPSKKSIVTAEQPARSSTLDEEFQQQQQQLLSLLQDTADIDAMAAIQIMARTAQQLKSSVPNIERTNSQQS
jgi:hypothetical protein